MASEPTVASPGDGANPHREGEPTLSWTAGPKRGDVVYRQEPKSKPLNQADSNWSNVPDEIEIDDDALAGGIDLTRFSRDEIRAMSPEDLRKLIRQGHEADKQREKRDKAQDEALAALIDALEEKEADLRAEYEAKLAGIRKERDEAKALVDYRGSSLKVNMPKWREGAGNHLMLVLLLVVLLTGGGGVLLGGQIGGGVHVNASAESNATVIQAETVEGILRHPEGGDPLDSGWNMLSPTERAAFRAEGIDPYATNDKGK